MNCRDFLTEFEERKRLTEAATLHLNDCPDCKKTSSEQTRVWQMIDVLPRVDAPNNFDFRVKARIANSKSADFQPRFFPVLRYVMPLSVVVMLVGLIAFNTTYFSGNQSSEPPTAKNIIESTIVRENMPPNASSTNQLVYAESKDEESAVTFPTVNNKQSTNQNMQFVATKLPSSRQIKTPKSKVEKDSGGGNHVISVRKVPVYLPKNMDTNQTNTSVSNPEDPKTINQEQLLSFIGIETVLENAKRTVKSVTKNSLAERSGVKVGDVIEAIDGKKISGEPKRSKAVALKNLTVLRGANKIEIPLKN
ncbi:MAG: PDZ domain-containing protein [Acidobacteriota bacterium]|nr:PDZ domain-containing protein [Acidobacteriota bacterium]